MDARTFGASLNNNEKQAFLGPLLAKVLAGGKVTGKALSALDSTSASVLRGLGSGASGLGGLFKRLGVGGAAAGRGMQELGGAAAGSTIKNEALADIVKMLGHGTRATGRLVENTGGGAGVLSSGFNALGAGLNRVADIGKGLPTAAVGALGYGGAQAGVLQNPVNISPRSDHIDIDLKSPVTLPKGVRELVFGKQKPKPRPLYSATGRRFG